MINFMMTLFGIGDTEVCVCVLCVWKLVQEGWEILKDEIIVVSSGISVKETQMIKVYEKIRMTNS